MKNATYNKSSLIRELAFNTGVTQKSARFVLDALQQIAYREARNQGITIPGLCRLDVIRRKARKMRNPQTGENILIAEHDTLRVRLLKRARNTVTPIDDHLITVLPTESSSAPKILDDFTHAVSFRCKKCGQEIEAPVAAAGMMAECPACGMQITVPAESEPGTLHGPALPPPPAPTAATAADGALSTPPPPPPVAAGAQQKNQTIRIDLTALGFEGAPAAKTEPKKRMLSFFCKNCRQEIESPADMAGTAAECPSCGVSFEVPFFSDPGTLHGSDLDPKNTETIKQMKSRTIRIEVPDDL